MSFFKKAIKKVVRTTPAAIVMKKVLPKKVTKTLTLGLAYIEALKKYMKAKLKGEEMPLSDLSTVLTEQYQYYAKSKRQTLKDDDSDDDEPRAISIS